MVGCSPSKSDQQYMHKTWATYEKGDFIVHYAKELSLKKYGQLAFTAFLQESLNAMQTLKFRTFLCRFSELH
jgi:hypothetical protein